MKLYLNGWQDFEQKAVSKSMFFSGTSMGIPAADLMLTHPAKHILLYEFISVRKKLSP